MRFKVDENMPVEVARLLRENGHDAVTVLDQHMGGAADEVVAVVCQRERRAVVTLNKGFGDIRAIRLASMQDSSCCASMINIKSDCLL